MLTTEANRPPESVVTTGVQKRPQPREFIAYLLRLVSENNPKRTDRQALAELRSVLRGTPADYLRAARHVVPYLGDEPSKDDRWFYLAGALLALHPNHVRPVAGQTYGPSLGAALGKLSREGGSMDNRILALLGSPADSLEKPLRQMISLLAQNGIGLDYDRLLNDLFQWDHPEHWVQKKWAHDYFRSGKAASLSPDTDTETSEKEDES